MAQQVSISIGLMGRTASAIAAVGEADIWFMDSCVRYIKEVKLLRDVELTNVRSVPVVKWAVPFYKGLQIIHMPDGLTQQLQIADQTAAAKAYTRLQKALGLSVNSISGQSKQVGYEHITNPQKYDVAWAGRSNPMVSFAAGRAL